MKYTIALISVLFSLSTLASGNIQSATLRCQDDDLADAGMFVVAELHVADGEPTAAVDKLTIPLSEDTTAPGFGVFTKHDFTSWQGNIMASTSFKHTVQYDGEEYKEKARFGFQEINGQIIAYLNFKSDLDEGTAELLLTCEKVIVNLPSNQNP